MAVTPSEIIAPGFVTNATTTAYTSTAAKTRIDYMTFTNESAANVTFNLYIGNPADVLSPRIKNKTVLPGEAYSCPEVIGALLQPGYVIKFDCSAASALYGSANGFLFT
jgi:hypothetical protein